MTCFKNIHDRYVDAKFESKTSQGSFFFQLRDELQGSKRVVVKLSDSSKHELKRNEFYEVFLERLTGGDRWIASIIKPEKNPWLNRSVPILGTAVYGKVVRYRGNHSAIIEFEQNGVKLEAEMPRSTLPRNVYEQDIQDTLFIGDEVGGLVTSVSYDRLEIELDLMAWLELQRKAWRYLMRDEAQGLGPLIQDRHRAVQKNRTDLPKLSRIRCLAIDDEEPVLNTLHDLLLEQGCRFEKIHVSKDTVLSEVVKKIERFDGIIIADFQLSDDVHFNKSVFDALEKRARNSETVDTLVYTGNNTKANNYAAQAGFGFLLKPATSMELISWLKTPCAATHKDAELAKRKSNRIFAVETKTKQVISKANELLNRLVDVHGFLGAFWVVELAPDRYELRASSDSFEGKISNKLISSLSRSVVGRAVAREGIVTSKLPKRDPLHELCDVKNAYVSVHTINIYGHAPRCIVFLSESVIGQSDVEQIEKRYDHFELLIDSISQAETIDEIAAAAEQGRMALATLHELRSELNPVLGLDYEKLKHEELVELLRDSAPIIQGLVQEQLRDFRPMLATGLPVNETVAKVVTKLGRYLRDSPDLDYVDLEYHPSAQLNDLTLNVNPTVVERTLSNLIDNAAHFVQSVNFKKVWVRTIKNLRDELPIQIVVEDTGPGVSVVDRERLFMPRSTGRPGSSTGYGLYISSEFVNSIGGKIICDTRPRWGGASFRICLPMMV